MWQMLLDWMIGSVVLGLCKKLAELQRFVG